MRSEDDRGFQKFLDTVQYKCSGILRYERVFGQGYVSTGGLGMFVDCRLSSTLLAFTDELEPPKKKWPISINNILYREKRPF